VAKPFAPAPPGTALSDCARRNPSEILSQTQSVSAFLPRSLSDIDRSTTANDPQPSASFSARKNPQCIPANTPPVFPGLRPRIWPHLLRLVTKAMSDRLLASLDGHPVPPAISAPGYATPRERPQQHKKKRTGRLQARPLNASPYSVPYCFTAQCYGDGYFVRNECNSPLARRAPWPLSHCPSTLACFSLQRVHWSILDCACSASGRISRLPSPLGGDGVRF
jgi:hypothetical protein